MALGSSEETLTLVLDVDLAKYVHGTTDAQNQLNRFKDAAKRGTAALRKTKGALNAITGGYKKLVAVLEQAAMKQAKLIGSFGSVEAAFKALEATNFAISMDALADGVATLQQAGIGLELTAGQMAKMGDVATQMGISGDDAFRRFSEAISKGSTRQLAAMGIFLDSQIVIRDYARAHDTATTALTNAEKQAAVQEAAIRALNETMTEGVTAFNELDRAQRVLDDAWTRFQVDVLAPLAGGLADIINLFRDAGDAKGVLKIQQNWMQARRALIDYEASVVRTKEQQQALPKEIANLRLELARLQGDSLAKINELSAAAARLAAAEAVKKAQANLAKIQGQEAERLTRRDALIKSSLATIQSMANAYARTKKLVEEVRDEETGRWQLNDNILNSMTQAERFRRQALEQRKQIAAISKQERGLAEEIAAANLKVVLLREKQAAFAKTEAGHAANIAKINKFGLETLDQTINKTIALANREDVIFKGQKLGRKEKLALLKTQFEVQRQLAIIELSAARKKLIIERKTLMLARQKALLEAAILRGQGKHEEANRLLVQQAQALRAIGNITAGIAATIQGAAALRGAQFTGKGTGRGGGGRGRRGGKFTMTGEGEAEAARRLRSEREAILELTRAEKGVNSETVALLEERIAKEKIHRDFIEDRITHRERLARLEILELNRKKRILDIEKGRKQARRQARGEFGLVSPEEKFKERLEAIKKAPLTPEEKEQAIKKAKAIRELDRLAQAWTHVGDAAAFAAESQSAAVRAIADAVNTLGGQQEKIKTLVLEIQNAIKGQSGATARAAEAGIMIGGRVVAGFIKDEKAKAVVLALMETAAGIASLAAFNYPGAALHFASAALYGAVAGTGKRSTAGGAGAAGAAARGGATASAQMPERQKPGHTIININAPVIGATPQEVGAQLHQLVSKANGTGFGAEAA
ncbi:MAG: coiled-coil domain-containing protein [Planctomycetota bacterium]|jgi:hypothetical protein